jgi:hypothetical protein
MKHTQIRKGTKLALVLMLGFFLVPTAQTHAMHEHTNQFASGHYQYQTYSAPVQTQYDSQRIQLLLQQISQLQLLLQQLEAQVTTNHQYNPGPEVSRDSDSEVEVDTRSATDVTDDSARVRGVVSDFDRSDYADVWFEYGRTSSDLDMRTPITRIDEDDDEDFDFRLVGLRDDQRYYFRAVAEDDDEEKAYGSIEDFQTDDDRYYDDDRNDDEPDVSVQSAYDIDDDSARFEGEVDMNDFENGEVFFVYGTDEDQIDDLEDDYESYYDVDEDGDYLQKFRLDSNLDRDSNYQMHVTGLDDNTDYYYRLCVGYEDEDGDDVLKCSSTRDFETD